MGKRNKVTPFAMKIGVLSDTHGWLEPKILEFLKGCDEVWHCGDIGALSVTDVLAKHFPLRVVYGNIDDTETRHIFHETEIFTCEGIKVLMTHIGGYPGHYDSRVRLLLDTEHPGLFLCGHSHIVKVMYDKKRDCLHINPGAAGRHGFHQVKTAVRFHIDNGRIHDLELGEWPREVVEG